MSGTGAGDRGERLRWLTLGARADGSATSFCVWAPESRLVEVVLYESDGPGAPAPSRARDVRRLQRTETGYWSGRVAGVAAGALYKFRLDGDEGRTFPDPVSRFQPLGVHGPSVVVEAETFHWTDDPWVPPALADLVIYELHVGTFTPEGTFRGVAERLQALVDLGVTAIELMPVADFPGQRNWGYDGVALFAPARCYGTPDDLRALVDAAHAHGLAVFLDVVYNHLGPDGAYANAFSPHYFTDAHESPWGCGVNLDRPHSTEVRRLFIENALHWIEEYHVDGLRLDATHALVDEGPRHFLEELTTTVRTLAGRPVLFVAEDHRNLAAMLQPVERGGDGLDGVWADDFHHQVRVHTAGDREGYYGDFTGTTGDLARTIEQGWFFTGQPSVYLGHRRGTDPAPLHPCQFVICIQNHDQIGNRADGARLHHQIDAATWRAISTLLLLAPQTPLLFMGQEWAATSPFQYFTDHHAELGRLVTEGRRREFQSFAAFADPAVRERIPDPQAATTFERSRLDWSERADPVHAGTLRLYERVLALRRASRPLRDGRDAYRVHVLDEETVALDYRHGALLVVVRLGGGGEVSVGAPADASLALSSEDAAFAPDAQPITIERQRQLTIRFDRPGAVVLRAGW